MGLAENYDLLGYYATCGGNFLPTFQDTGTIIKVQETSVRNCHYGLRNGPEERSSHLLRGESLKLAFCTSTTNQFVNGAQGNNRSFWESQASTSWQNGESEVAHVSCYCSLMG
jgi:hypothetical protein